MCPVLCKNNIQNLIACSAMVDCHITEFIEYRPTWQLSTIKELSSVQGHVPPFKELSSVQGHIHPFEELSYCMSKHTSLLSSVQTHVLSWRTWSEIQTKRLRARTLEPPSLEPNSYLENTIEFVLLSDTGKCMFNLIFKELSTSRYIKEANIVTMYSLIIPCSRSEGWS